jgi:murein DD-endopeptidase MepM/ murein hydrolase activator NlpD
MKLDLNKFLGVVVIAGFLLANTALSYFEGEVEDFELKGQSPIDRFEELDQEFDKEEVISADEFIDRLRTELNISKTDYKQIVKNINDTHSRLEIVNEEKDVLTRQLVYLEELASTASEKLFAVMRQVIEKENKIQRIYEQIEIKNVAIEYQKTLLADYIRVLYEEENALLDPENGELSAMKLLLTDGTVSANLKDLKYLDVLNEAGQQMLDNLNELSEELVYYKEKVKKEKFKLEQLQVQLENDKELYEAQRAAKENLVKVTQGQEQIYGQLLEQSIREQEEVLTQIKELADAVTVIEQTIEIEGENFNPDDFADILDGRTKALYEFHLQHLDKLPDGEFLWPVEPERGISAYFRDPSYSSVFGVRHNAIDLPVLQGSMVRTAGDGVVYTAKDNGFGYSYIIIAHSGGYQTVYGHMSKILVKEGQKVRAGAIIGLSGGMPGTKGAGYMTTGPHLHFEMLRNGIHVDPLTLLSLGTLSRDNFENLPERYLEQWKDEVLINREMPVAR